MSGVARAVFRALHEGKWLSIEYRNGSDKVTRFWIGIRGLDAKNRSLIVDGLHLHDHTVEKRMLYLDRVQWAEVVEGSFCPRNEALLRDMDNDPRRYDALFGSTANLRVLDYLAACSKLDNTPYRADYQLIERLDESRLQNGVYQLDDGQFRQIVERFQQRTTRKRRPGEPLRLVSLGLNLLSIPTKDGLYVLAYRALYLDVKNRTLRRRYRVAEEYDYLQNSVYKCFLACDALSDEVLLSYHYRCHPKIVSFNNKKYYNNRLHIASQVESDRPLVYLDVPENTTSERNTAPQEVQPILHYLRRYPERSVGIITPFARQRALIRETLRDNQLPDDACGTVHAFQGDEKDVIIFSLALTDRTRQATYNWLKDNKELLNVAVSRARKQLVIVSSQKELDRLHAAAGSSDDLYELVQYTRTNGASVVTEKPAASRALGIKPYSTKTEAAFLENLNHALDNAELYGGRCVVRKEVPISQVFVEDEAGLDLFYTGRFDFVVYQKYGREERPVFAIELDGREHREDPIVQKRDRKKEAICEEHGFQLIRVENSYARRYHYIKDILIRFFKATR